MQDIYAQEEQSLANQMTLQGLQLMAIFNKAEECVSLAEYVHQDQQPLYLALLVSTAKILQLGCQQAHVKEAIFAVMEKLLRIQLKSFAALDFTVKQELLYKFHVRKEGIHLVREHLHWITARHVHLDKFVIKKVWLDL